MAEPTEMISFAEFLEGTPPNCRQKVSDATIDGQGLDFGLKLPALQLHCSHCNGVRRFKTPGMLPLRISVSEVTNLFIDYHCSNCSMTHKFFALRIGSEVSPGPALCMKYGEVPQFGQPTPNRLLRIIESDKENFFKGRQCENQGLGIGAFSYYRRVVENQKDQIFDEMIKALNKLGANSGLVEEFEQAKNENQFKTAMEKLKGKLPEDLLIKGQNPLIILHSALSKGLHGQTDEECLQTAHDIRILLVEFSGRLADVVKNNQELDTALNNLINPKK